MSITTSTTLIRIRWGHKISDRRPLHRSQYVNWYIVFFEPRACEQVFFEPDCGLIYNYASGDNQYNRAEHRSHRPISVR